MVFSRSSLEHAVAGSAGTGLATLLLFPLDRIKTLAQVDPDSYPSFLQTLVSVLRDEGLRGLYLGCGPMLQTVSSSNFLYFFLFEGLKARHLRMRGSAPGSVGAYATLVASALAGALNMVITEPLWRACVVAQAAQRWADGEEQSPSFSPRRPSGVVPPVGVFGTVYRMGVEEGLPALWRGLPSSLWLVSNPVIQFFVYDMLKAMRRQQEGVSSAEAFVMGAVAKALATVLTFPLQVAQSRLRAARGRKVSEVRGGELDGMVACLSHVYTTNGVTGLYVGLVPKLVQTVTTAAFMFAFYEKIHRLIRRGVSVASRRRRALPRGS